MVKKITGIEIDDTSMEALMLTLYQHGHAGGTFKSNYGGSQNQPVTDSIEFTYYDAFYAKHVTVKCKITFEELSHDDDQYTFTAEGVEAGETYSP